MNTKVPRWLVLAKLPFKDNPIQKLSTRSKQAAEDYALALSKKHPRWSVYVKADNGIKL